MSKLRSISTKFWTDPFVEELTNNQKLLFIYLLTNEMTNMLGIYEITIRKMSFDTGIKKEDVEEALSLFKMSNKVDHVDNYIFIRNFLKHQHFNPNMKKSAINNYNMLPEQLKIKGLNIDVSEPLEAFESLLNHSGMVRKIEIEKEYKYENKKEMEMEKFIPPTLDDISNYLKDKLVDEGLNILNHSEKLSSYELTSKKFYSHYTSNGWKVGSNLMKNWKAAMDKWLLNQNETRKPEISEPILCRNR